MPDDDTHRPVMTADDRRAWQAARTLADLGQLTARWLEGTITSQPGYMPGHGPDPETGPLVPVLAACNRAGYLTCASQPGEAGRGYDGAWWEQRAAVEGFAPAELAERICEVAEGAGLTVIAHPPATLPRRRIRYHHAEPVTVRETRPGTWFGAQLSRRHLRDDWTGYGICHHVAVAALCAAWQVTVIDPAWGRNDRLWPILGDAMAPAARRVAPDPHDASRSAGADASPEAASDASDAADRRSPVVMCVDECQAMTGDVAAEAAGLAEEIIRLGRAAGMVVVTAPDRPEGHLSRWARRALRRGPS